MSTTIDQRVVEMRFDNKQFETNVSTTMSTLDKLKQSLNLSGASKGLENVSTAAKKVDLSGIGVAAETVGLKFNAMYTMADQAFRRLTDSAMNAGKRIISALTLDPIKSGFSEYETQINAIQTILANTESKGTTLDQVNSALDTLNTYADKTIYNFTEMTNNIGRFTAAGVDLNTSVTAIQGIANLAAVSGSTSQQASTAMYQLSQALSSGTVKLMDWNSVVNAGMGGQVFQNAIMETARVHDIAIDELIKNEGSFRDTLQKGWLTSEILIETLEKFTMTTEGLTEAEIARNRETLKTKGYTDEQIDAIFKLGETATNAATKVKTLTQLWDTLKEAAQSGWTQTWELIVGDFGESKELFTGISDAIGSIIGESAKARNDLLDGALTNNWDKLVKKINEAGVETADFEKHVKNFAKSQSIDIDSVIEKYGSLEDAFRKGAVSSDILKGALSSTNEIIKETSKDAVTYTVKSGDNLTKIAKKYGMTVDEIAKLNNIKDINLINTGQILTISEALTTTELAAIGAVEGLYSLIDGVTELGGRELLIESFKNIFKTLGDVVSTVKDAFRQIFPPMTSEQLYNFLEGFKNLTELFKLSDINAVRLEKTFKGLFSIFSIIGKAISAVFNAIVPLFSGVVGSLGTGILKVTADLGDWITNLNTTIEKTDAFNVAIQWVVNSIKKVIDAVKNFFNTNETINKTFDSISNSIKTAVNALEMFWVDLNLKLIQNGGIIGVTKTIVESLKSLFNVAKEKFAIPGLETIKNFLSDVHKAFSKNSIETDSFKIKILDAAKSIGFAFKNSGFVKGLESLMDGIISVGGKIIEGLGSLISGIVEAIGNIDLGNILNIFNSASFAAISVGIYKFIKKITNPLDSFNGGVKDMFKGLTGILDGVKGSLEAYQNSLNAKSLMEIAKAIGVLAAAVLVMSMIDSEKLSASVGAITMLFIELSSSMVIMNKFGGTLNTGAIQMVALASSILILAGACKSMSSLSWDELVKGLVGVGTIMGAFFAFTKYSDIESATIKSSAAIVVLAGALKLMASACKSFGSIDTETLVKGVAAIAVILWSLGDFVNMSSSTTKDIIKVSAAITAIGASMRVFAKSCKMFGELDLASLAKGLTSIVVILTTLAQFVTKVDGVSTKMVSIGVGFIAIAASMLVFAEACKSFGSIDVESLAKGLVSVGVILVEVAAMAKIAGSAGGNLASIGIGMIGVAAAMIVISEAIKIMGGMEIGELAKGLSAMGVSIGILAVGLKAMTGTLSGSAAMLVAAAAMALLVPTIGLLGSFKTDTIVKGLLAIAGAIAVFGVAAGLLTPVIPAMLSLAGALALVGVGILALGAAISLAGIGFGAFITGVLALAGAGAGAATAIVAALSVIVTGIAALIPTVVQKIGEAIIIFCQTIADGAPVLGEALKQVILTAISVLVECVPQIVDGALVLITEVLNSLGEYAPTIVEGLFNFITGIIQATAAKIPELINVTVTYFGAFFTGIVDALKGLGTETLVTTIAGIGLLAGVMAALGAITSLIPGAIVGVLGMGVVVAELAIVLAAIGALAQIPGLDWLINEGAGLLESIGNAIGSLVGGIIGGVASGVTGQFPQIGTDLSDFMTNATPFIEGAKSIDASVMEGVNTLASVILKLTAADLLSGITSFITGGSSLSDFGTELAAFGPNIKAFADSITGLDTNLVTNAANAAQALSDMASKLPNTGGLVSFFTGDNDMATFGTNLKQFGLDMAEYATSVSGVDANVVTNSANAASALAELQNSLSPTGGIFAIFKGDSGLGTFGTNLKQFGKDFGEFGTSISGVDANVVTAVSNAASALVTLEGSLPKEGGWFSGDVSLADFAGDLKTFGTKFKDFYTEISGIDVLTLSTAVDEVSDLIDLTSGLATLDFSGVATFQKALKDLGKSGIDGFVSAFTNAGSTITTTIETMLSNFATGVNNQSFNITTAFNTIITSIMTSFQTNALQFVTVGQIMINNFINGVNFSSTNVITAITTLLNNIKTTINSKNKDFQTAGTTLMTNFITGIKSKNAAAINAISSIISGMVTNVRNKYSQFYEAGKYLVEGFAAGITANTFIAEARAAAMAAAALSAAKKELRINSPSKEAYSLGNFFGLGFVNAIGDSVDAVEAASSEMAHGAIDGLNSMISKISDYVSADLDVHPTITPVLDMSSVEHQAAKLNSMFTRSQAMSISTRMNERLSANEIQNDSTTPVAGNVYQFTQNNYSPKELSRIEIYRQTKNQFSALKGLVSP